MILNMMTRALGKKENIYNLMLIILYLKENSNWASDEPTGGLPY